MSDHTLRVFRVSEVWPWPQSDQLDAVEIEGWLCAVRRGDFKAGDLAVYIEPDFVVPTCMPEFEFLALNRDGTKRDNPPARYRITARKLRGTWSQGLVIHARPEWREGQDVRELLGVVRYVAPAEREIVRRGFTRVGPAKGPREITVPYYDIEAGRKFSKPWREFLETHYDDVVVTEKIHGANMAVVFTEGKLQVRSRTVWKRRQKHGFWARAWSWLTRRPLAALKTDWWWSAVDQNPWIETWCRENQDMVLFGEVFGPDVQGASAAYGLNPGQFGFRAFDVFMPISKLFWPFSALVDSIPSEGLVPYRRLAFGGAIEPISPTGPSEIKGAGIFREGLVYRGWSLDYTAEKGCGLPMGERLIFKDVCPQWLEAGGNGG